MAIYNIFIDIHKITNYTVSPIYNRLSDRDAQLLIVKDVKLQLFKHLIDTVRDIHKYSIEDFKIRLNYESWNSIFGNSRTNSWSGALLEKLPIVQPLEKFPALYGNRRFIIVFTTALHWSLS
jgi:hypothetical protein